MARAKKIQEHLQHHDALASWASKYKVLSDPYVAGLLAALEQRRNLSMWATLSPLEYLPQPTAHAGKSRLLFWVTLLRNTLIFAPVALTWSAVGHATTAFGIYVGENTGSVINFLEFWQNGYGVLSQTWTIGHIATLDFIMIAMVIVLIAFLHFANERERLRFRKAEDLADTERMAIAISLHSYLFDKRSTSNVKMNENLATATQDLLRTSSSLEKTAKIIEKSTKETPTNKQIMADLKTLVKVKKPRSWDSFLE